MHEPRQMLHLEHQRLDQKIMNGIEILRPGLGIVQGEKTVQMHGEPIELVERKLNLQLRRQRLDIPSITKPTLENLTVTQHKKRADRKTDGLVAELLRPAKRDVRLAPIATTKAADSGGMAMRRAVLMLGTFREGACVEQEMRQILGIVGDRGAAAPSPGKLWSGTMRKRGRPLRTQWPCLHLAPRGAWKTLYLIGVADLERAGSSLTGLSPGGAGA